MPNFTTHMYNRSLLVLAPDLNICRGLFFTNGWPGYFLCHLPLFSDAFLWAVMRGKCLQEPETKIMLFWTWGHWICRGRVQPKSGPG